MASAAGIKAGRAYVQVGTDESGLVSGLKSAEARLKNFGSAVSGLGLKVGGVGLAISGGLLLAAKSFADTGSNLADMSVRTGLSVEALSQLGHAAAQTGTDMSEVETAAKKLQKNISDAAQGSIEARSSFALLGLDFRKLLALRPDAAFASVAKAVGKVRNPSLQAGAALEMFGRSGTSLIPLAENFGTLTAEARRFNLVWTGDQAKKADDLGDALDLLVSVGKSVFQTLGSALAPTLTSLATSISEIGAKVIRWTNANGPLIVTVAKIGVGIVGAGAALVALGLSISATGALVGALATGLGFIASVLGLVLSPIGLIAGGLALLAGVFVTSTETGKQAVAKLGTGFDSLKDTATKAFGAIGDALKGGDISLAGEVLWAALDLEFQKGLLSLTSLWDSTLGSWTDSFSAFGAEIVKIMNTINGSLSKQMNTLKSEGSSWGASITAFLDKALPGHKEFRQATGLDPEKAFNSGLGLLGVRTPDADKRRADLAGANEATDTATSTQNRFVDSGQDTAAQERNAARMQSIRDAQKRVQDAQDKFNKVRAEAADVGAKADEKKPEAKKKPDFDPASLDQALNAVRGHVEVKGSFQANRGALNIGNDVSDVVKQGVDQQKKTNEKLDGIRRALAYTNTLE